MGFYENNNTIVHELEEAKRTAETNANRFRHVDDCFQKVINFVLGKNYYNMAGDSWSCETECMSDIIDILDTPLINFILDRRVKKKFMHERKK